jgi:hypothetical protein
MASHAPINALLKNPTEVPLGWDVEEQKWLKLNQEIGGNEHFYPLTIKGAYVIGVIYCLCQSVSLLLEAPNTQGVTYIPAYGVFASGVELLGRCIRGNTSLGQTAKDLRVGYKWLAYCSDKEKFADHQDVPNDYVLVETAHFLYTIENLVALRHYAAHGQATTNISQKGEYQFGHIDFEILSHMPPLIADGLARFWHELLNNEETCNKLAAANVIALRGWPIRQSWVLFEKDQYGRYHGISEIFNRFVWSV